MDRSNKGIRVECAGPFFYIETMYKTKWREVKGMVFGTDLTGKMAVVTGAGGILCGMFARTLAGAGASVALLDINLEAAEKIAGEIRDMGGTASA